MSFSEIVEMLQKCQETSDKRFDLVINSKKKIVKIEYK